MLRAQVILLQEGREDGLSTPLLSYDAEGDRIQAWVSASEEFEKLSLSVMRSEIHVQRAQCNGALGVELSDLQREDFVLKVVTNRGKLLAECDQSDCVFH
jgi:hypothetical protein